MKKIIQYYILILACNLEGSWFNPNTTCLHQCEVRKRVMDKNFRVLTNSTVTPGVNHITAV